MASHQVSANIPWDFVDRTRATAKSVADNTSAVTTPANYSNVAALDARLTAISATTYSQANLDRMTINDKIYALRLADDGATL